jgi:hypothetical protein
MEIGQECRLGQDSPLMSGSASPAGATSGWTRPGLVLGATRNSMEAIPLPFRAGHQWVARHRDLVGDRGQHVLPGVP